MKTIDTLVEDMYNVVDGKIEEYVHDHLSGFGEKLEAAYASRIKFREHVERGTLRLSSMGTPCVRKLWLRQNLTDLSKVENLHPSARLKFFFGDILEEILLQLARDSGHVVTGEQDEIRFNGIVGHRDCVIDGVTIDCKSASSFSFKKFSEGLQSGSDSFGYLTQLAAYIYGAKDDPLVTNKELGGFLVIDKQHGHICLDLHTFNDPSGLAAKFEEIKTTVNQDVVEPPRPYKDEADGKSGNRKLGLACSYCEYKKECWPNLRTYLYSNGPRFLTKVVKEPNVYEVK